MKLSRFFGLPVLALSILVLAGNASATTQVKNADGKVVLIVDKDNIKLPDGGKQVMTVDGDNVKNEAGAVVLYINGDNIRNKPEGDMLLFIDGRHIKRKPGGKELLYVDGKNLMQPDQKGKKIYRFDGDDLTSQRRMAVLFYLMPELFDPSK